MGGVRQASAERIIVFARHRCCLAAAHSQVFPRALRRPRGRTCHSLPRSCESKGLRRHFRPTAPLWTRVDSLVRKRRVFVTRSTQSGRGDRLEPSPFKNHFSTDSDFLQTIARKRPCASESPRTSPA